MQVFSKIVLTVIVLVFGMTFPLWYLNEEGFFNLSKLEATSAQKTYTKSLFADLNQRLIHFQNRSLLELDLREINEVITQEKWIKKFEVYRDWPNKVRIEIEPNNVALVYWNEKNEAFSIFENNEMLGPVTKSEIPDRIFVFEPKIANQKDLRKKTIDIVKQLPAKGPMHSEEISEIGYNVKDGFWVHLIKQDLLVNLGEDKIEMKSERVSKVINYLSTHQINARVIDANLSQKVLVRLRKDP